MELKTKIDNVFGPDCKIVRWNALTRVVTLSRAVLLAAVVVAIIAIAAAAYLATRGPAPTASPTPAATPVTPAEELVRRLVIAIPEEPESIDIQQVTWANEIHELIFEPLVILDPDMKLVPAQAVSWEVVDGGKSIIFVLPEGAVFSTGNPLNAEAVKETIERYRRLSPYAEDFAVVERIEIINETAVKLVCKEPPAYLWAVLVTAYGAPVDVKHAEELGDEEFGRAATGAGPYKIKEWVHGSHVLLVRNDNYRTNIPFVQNKGPNPYIDEVLIRFIPEDLTRITDLLAGNVHIVRDVPIDMLDQLRGREDVRLYETLSPGIHYIAVNVRDEILKDINVRKAIMIAIDREELVEALRGTAIPWHSLLSPTVIGYEQEAEEWAKERYKHDPELAARLLDEAGWRVGPDGVRVKDGKRLELTLLVPSDVPALRKVAPVIQAQLEKVGIKVTLKEIENAFVRRAIRQWEFQLALQRYSWADGDILIYLLHSEIANRTYANPRVDELLEKARTIMDPEERARTYTEIQKMVLEELPMIPLFVTKSYTAVRAEVQGIIVLPPYGQILINDAKIVKRG